MPITHIRLGIACIAMIVMASSCSSPTSTPTRSATPREKEIAQEVHIAINRYRQSQNLPPLQRHAGLDQLARGHSQYLASRQGSFSLHGKNVSHHRFDWRAKQASSQYRFLKFGENVASMKTKPGQQGANLLILWVASEGHRKNIHGDWTHTGIGIQVAPDGYILATQLFASQ